METAKKHVKIKKEIIEMGGGDDALERRNLELAMLGQLKFEEELIRMHIECGRLKEKTASGTVSAERLKIEEEGYGDVCEEHKKMISEKNMIIYELSKKLNEMKNEIFDKDQNLGLCKEKLRAFERREAQMKEEVERLGQQESESNRIIERLRYEVSQVEAREKNSREKSMEACDIIDQLKNQKMAAEARLRKLDETMKQVRQKQLESDRTVEELRRQNLEAHQTVEDMRSQLLARESHKKVSDRTIEDLRRKDVEAHQCVEDLRRRKSEAEHVAGMQRRKFDRTMEEIRRKLLEAERTIKELRQTEEDLKRQNSAAYKAAQVFTNKYDNLVPITIGLAKLLNVKVDGLVNLESKGSVDEGVNFWVSGSGKRVSRDEIVDAARSNVKLARTSSICNSAESGPNSLLRRGGATSLALESGILSTSKQPSSATDIIEIIDDCDDETEDGKVVNRFTNNLLPSGCDNSSDHVQRRNTSKTWMLRAFQEDNELCLKAVCALYRLKVSAPESGYYHLESMRGNALAKYLIDGDSQLRLRKSVSQVKLESMDIIEKCRRLAVDYYERLFMLYCNGDDPFFGPT